MNNLITLQYPWALLLLLPLIALWWWQRTRTPNDSKWQKWIDPHLLTFLLQQHAPTRRRRLRAILVVWIIACIALAGPSVKRDHQSASFSHDSAHVILLDLTPSMRADDVKPSRLARAKIKAMDWLKQHQEGQTALVVYSGSAHVVVPFSTDTRTVAALLPTLDTSLPPLIGNDPVQALKLIEKMRRDSGLARADVLWLSDGFDADQSDAINAVIHDSALRLSLLAVGSEAGAPVQMSDKQLLTDGKGQIVLAKVEVTRLFNWAQQHGVRFAPLQAGDNDLRALAWPLSTQDDFSNAESVSLQWQDLGGWLCVLLLPLAFWALRRASLAMLFLGLLTQAPRSEASWWTDLWQTRDQQAAQALSANDHAKAAQLFERRDWRGVAHYRDGKFGDAAQSFAQLNNDDALFNQANALAYAQRYDEAKTSYEKVLQHTPSHRKAKENLAALNDFLQRQAQQQAGQSAQQKDQSEKGQDSLPNKPPQNSQAQQEQSQDQSQRAENGEQQKKSTPQANQSPSQGAEGEQKTAQNQQQAQPSKEHGDKQKNAEVSQTDDHQKPPKPPTDPQVEALLRQLPDDPGGLLRRRMKLELARRGQTEPEAQTQGKW